MRLAFVWLLLLAAPALAESGLADLQSALQRLTPDTQLEALISVKLTQVYGKGDERVVHKGRANASVHDSGYGLRLGYGEGLLRRQDAEGLAKANNAEAPTPVTRGLAELTPLAARSMVRAAESLEREIESAEYAGEQVANYQGQRARRLDFALPISRLTKRERKYVKGTSIN